VRSSKKAERRKGVHGNQANNLVKIRTESLAEGSGNEEKKVSGRRNSRKPGEDRSIRKGAKKGWSGTLGPASNVRQEERRGAKRTARKNVPCESMQGKKEREGQEGKNLRQGGG